LSLEAVRSFGLDGRVVPPVLTFMESPWMEDTMPIVSIPDDTFRRLADRAAALNISVDDLVKPALDRLAEGASAPAEPLLPLTGDAWRAELDAWKRDAEGRAGRYSPGFVLDDSREAIYREREDAQL
jgi:hypothetical protein